MSSNEPKVEPSTDSADRLIKVGEVLVKIGKMLKPYNDTDRRLVLRMVAEHYGFTVS